MMEEQLKENNPIQESSEVKEADQRTEPIEEKEKTVKKKRHLFVIISVIVFFVLTAAGYVGIGVYYQTHFLPNTIINGIDFSGMEASSAAEMMDAGIQDYVLEITGREPSTGESGAVLGTIAAKDIEMTFGDTLGTLERIMAEQEWLLWIRVLTGQRYESSIDRKVTYNEALAETLIKSWDACQRKNMVAAKNAYISEYSETLHGYEVIPETKGTELDVEQTIRCVEAALSDSAEELDLEDEGFYAEAEILQSDRRLTNPVETANRWLSTSITYDWNGNEVLLDAETIHEWVSIEDGQAVLDEEAVISFVREQARQYDTYGKKKKFVTTLGVEMTLTSASYGWRADREAEAEELLSLIQEGSTEVREPIYTHKAMMKSADNVNDIGNSYVEADLTNQHLYLYQDGEVVLETDFVSGKISNGNGTPAGIFGITYKTKNAVLRGENYETPVNYWMPFFGNYGMHDATWRGAFGGNIYLNGGSHGCINLPRSMAEQIYEYVSTGFPVICYYYEVPVVPTENEELPDPEMAAQEMPAQEIPATEIPAQETEMPEIPAQETEMPEIPAQEMETQEIPSQEEAPQQ